MLNIKYNIIKYTYLLTGNLSLGKYHDKNYITDDSVCLPRSYKYKMACYADTIRAVQADLKSAITRKIYLEKDRRIWVSPDCITPRDIIRNSGYKIVKKQEDADRIIVPRIQETSFPVFSAHVLMYDKRIDALIFLTISDDSTILYLKNNPKLLSDYCTNNGYTLLSPVKENKYGIVILPKYEVYEDILTEKYPDRVYLAEDCLDLTYPNVITVETLQRWSRMSPFEGDMLANMVFTSNWSEYPVTLCYFIRNSVPWLVNYGNAHFKNLLKTIGYSAETRYTLPYNTVVEPKDWNMLQEFLMAELGVSSNGGYASLTKDLKGYVSLYLRRFAVKPYKIDKPIALNTLLSLVGQASD